MSQPEFEHVLDEERRFELIATPDAKGWEPEQRPGWAKDLTQEQLERWRIEAILANKLDWIIRQIVTINNNGYHNETETIRSKKFRTYVWTRMTILVAVITIIGHLFLPFLREKLFPSNPNPQAIHAK